MRNRAVKITLFLLAFILLSIYGIIQLQEWIEVKDQNNETSIYEDIDPSAISAANITDKDGYLYSFNADKVPHPIIDRDLKQFFPQEAKKANIRSQTVVVMVQIDEIGTLKGVKIVSEKSGYGFDEAAIRIINLAKFTPGYVSGRPVKMAHRVPINFTLDE